MSEPWLSTDEIAAHLGVTKDTVYAWIADKGMPAHKIGRLWKCQATEVDEWVRTGAAASDNPHTHDGGGPYPEQAGPQPKRKEGR